ncbi:mitochondrial matrix Mmp37 [Aulographum hederae CBS 113979]|uniref:Phosphatidate cytidylyltransferase, mitochondrial n=1 Tax=Aulographum hederae CBS 113979 TaxID=1176131 RepID=A0A6G1HFQ6_9PEZI|nr:mitochondrial matrix Mmp37 [Aulographum hederae CBS 113979]
MLRPRSIIIPSVLSTLRTSLPRRSFHSAPAQCFPDQLSVRPELPSSCWTTWNSRRKHSSSTPPPSPTASQSSQKSSDVSSKASTVSDPITDVSNQSLPPGWEDDPNWNITAFSELPHRKFGVNQHMIINEEFKESLRQILWGFRAPIRYAFAYGSGVFSQTDKTDQGGLSPHPNPPQAIEKWQKGGRKMIDFIFGVSYTQHWHSLNLTQHRDHYSLLGSFGSGAVSRVQDNFGAGVYFNPYITVNGTMIKYGVANLDTIARDLSEWDTLYLAGRLHKPVKIIRDNPRIRLANQVNLISAIRTALLLLGPNFTERELFTTIAGLSYMGDPRMDYFNSENPRKVDNIVTHQMPNFRQLYNELIEHLPNVAWNDSRVSGADWAKDEAIDVKMTQDMDPFKRGNMVRRLPTAFRKKLYFLYQRKFGIPGREFNIMLEESRDEDATSFKRRQGTDFDRRIAREDDLGIMVRKAIKQTVQWPSSVQSVKSFMTAGVGKSMRYIKEKREKGRQKES